MAYLALSIKQPWAWLICAGMPLMDSIDNKDGSTSVMPSDKVVIKNIENRDWPTSYRGKFYVHASKRDDNEAQWWLMEKGFAPMMVLMLFSDKVPRGAIIGEVDLVDCVTEHPSPWFTGPWGFVLANPVLYEKPIPCKGRLGFFQAAASR